MNRKDWKEIARWAVLGALFTMGILGGQSAIGQNEGAPKRLPSIEKQVDPFTFRLQQIPSDRADTLKVRLTIVSGARSNETLKPSLRYVKMDFMGNGGGRTVSAADFKETQLDFRNATAKIKSGGEWSSDCDLKVPFQNGKPVYGTYAVQLVFGQARMLTLQISIMPPVKVTPMNNSGNGNGTEPPVNNDDIKV